MREGGSTSGIEVEVEGELAVAMVVGTDALQGLAGSSAHEVSIEPAPPSATPLDSFDFAQDRFARDNSLDVLGGVSGQAAVIDERRRLAAGRPAACSRR